MTIIDKNLIAPCGMNCALCLAYQRTKNKCLGCNYPDEGKSKSCLNCKIKHCDQHLKSSLKFCYECDKFPCQKIKHLDKRYKEKYRMSMIDNLEDIKNKGIDNFLKNEAKRWECKNCGSLVCVHRGICFNCNTKF